MKDDVIHHVFLLIGGHCRFILSLVVATSWRDWALNIQVLWRHLTNKASRSTVLVKTWWCLFLLGFFEGWISSLGGWLGDSVACKSWVQPSRITPVSALHEGVLTLSVMKRVVSKEPILYIYIYIQSVLRSFFIYELRPRQRSQAMFLRIFRNGLDVESLSSMGKDFWWHIFCLQKVVR